MTEKPGGGITCPYCQSSVAYNESRALVKTTAEPLRYSRVKMEMRAQAFGETLNPPNPNLTPEEWIAKDKLMPGALHNYRYAED
jgi:hypothetical protein